jgi:AraC-like DNA-binding protein
MPAGGLVFLHCGCTPECAATVDKRFDGYHTLQYAERGGVELAYGDRWRLLPWGEPWFWTAYPGPHIRFHAALGRAWWAHRYVAFRGPRVARWVAEGLWPEEPQPAPHAAASEYPARFDELLRLARLPDRWSVARAVNLLEALLIELAEDRSGGGASAAASTEPWLTELLEAVEGGEEWETFAPDYEAFAQAHGMALSTLRRRFREATGTPLHEWAVQVRVARARRLLGETDLPVKAVAERLGYRDVYFFTRQFRQSVGVPPAAYRRSRQD